jgi:hypothetical protein
MTIRQDNESHTFLIWKEHQLLEEERVSNWNWG